MSAPTTSATEDAVLARSGELHVYMVVGILGKGGMTAAMMNRARMFVDHGIPTTLVTLQHDLDHERRNDEYRTMGWLDPRVTVRNAFEDAAASASAGRRHDDAARRGLRGVASRLKHALRRDRTDEAKVPSHHQVASREQARRTDGSVETTTERDAGGRAVRLLTHDHDGAVRLESDLDPVTGAPVMDTYLSADGVPYFRRSYHDGAPAEAWSLKPSGGVARSYTGQTAWLSAYLTRLARGTRGDAVFICDGPGSAGKVLRVPRDRAATLYMVHNNHYKSPWAPGARVRDDYGWIFTQSHKMDALVVLTDEQARDIGNQYDNADTIRVVPNSVAQTPVAPAERDSRTVSMFARLVNQKNLFEAISLFKDVVAQVPDARLDIYGDGRLMDRLRAHITAEGLDGSVTMRGYTRDAPGVMARSALVLCTSYFEGLPVNFLEAYRAGTPMVSYACRYGPRDLVEDGVTGFVVPRKDRAALVDRIVTLLEDPERAQTMGEAGRTSILSRYDNELVFDTWWRVIGEARASLAERRAQKAGASRSAVQPVVGSAR